MGPSDLPARQLLMRIATWYGDEDSLRRHAATLPRDLLPRETGFLLLHAHYVLGGIDPAGIDQMFASQLERLAFSGRVLSNLHQVMAEAHAARGELDRALGHLGSAAGSALIDLDWLENCPLLDRLRPMGGFIAAQDRARRRAEPLRRL